MAAAKARNSLFSCLLAAFAALPMAAAAAENGMRTGSVTSQPIGHYEFCKANVAECSVRSRESAPVKASRALWKRVVATNDRVNNSVQPLNDIDIYGKDEVWTYPGAYGDCEDYVLEKRRLLMDAGIPSGNLLITVVRKPNGEGHAVLTLRTDKGDYILDNLRDDVRPWSATEYTFLKRQATFDTGKWVTISEQAPVLVGSVGTN